MIIYRDKSTTVASVAKEYRLVEAGLFLAMAVAMMLFTWTIISGADAQARIEADANERAVRAWINGGGSK
jgi:hypothetical protein